MDKDIKEKIKSLISEGKYDDIFREYGMKAYKKYVPSKYRKQDLARLRKEGRYEDIFNKYGKNEYNKILIKAMYEEIKEAKGGFKASIWKIAHRLKLFGLTAAFTVSLGLPSVTTAAAIMTQAEINNNSKEYKAEIEVYNEKIEGYAKDINKMGLSDIQVFMKVMDDMWKGIKGYAEPEKNIKGFYELDLANDDGYGVCRNMASDVAKKLNEINPKYNARIMAVLMGDDYYKTANIERNIIETNSTVEEKADGENNNLSKVKEVATNLLGNHMVTLVDVPEDNLTLVLDPTNPGIGIYVDGNIIMLNDAKGDRVKYISKEYSEAVLVKGGISGIIETASDYIKSFEKSGLSLEQIVDKYGLKAQNEALDYVRTMETIREAADGKNFRESLKVDLPKQNVEKNTDFGQNIQEKSNIELDR